MINKSISYYLTLTFRGWAPLRGELHSFWDTWLCCNFLEWGAPERRTRAPAQRGSGNVGDAMTAFHVARIPLRGRTFLRKALLLPCAVAPFRVVAPCPAPQNPRTSPRPTIGFRMIG